MGSATRVSAIIASRRRPHFLPFILRCLEGQTLPPTQVLISVVEPADVAPFTTHSLHVDTIFGPSGTTSQRNTALRQVDPEADFVVFVDDDFVPSRFFVEGVVKAFAQAEDAGGLTGRLLANGAQGAGVSLEEAGRLVAEADAAAGPAPALRLDESAGLYGCNMAFRASAIAGLTFDERLPLSGWLEDRDFSARIRGRRFKTNAFYGVHCGTKSGREQRGDRVGYSQIANPVYLVRKGTVHPFHAAKLVVRVLAANHGRALFPEAWLDRRGRMLGNWRALVDLACGRLAPERTLSLDHSG